jgi:hypothetical protein
LYQAEKRALSEAGPVDGGATIERRKIELNRRLQIRQCRCNEDPSKCSQTMTWDANEQRQIGDAEVINEN